MLQFDVFDRTALMPLKPLYPIILFRVLLVVEFCRSLAQKTLCAAYMQTFSSLHDALLGAQAVDHFSQVESGISILLKSLFLQLFLGFFIFSCFIDLLLHDLGVFKCDFTSSWHKVGGRITDRAAFFKESCDLR